MSDITRTKESISILNPHKCVIDQGKAAAAIEAGQPVYIDSNGNGVQDGVEKGYSNAGVYLSSGQTTTTNSSGVFSFANMHKGVYVVGLTVPSGYSSTTTNPAVSQILNGRATVNFGIK